MTTKNINEYAEKSCPKWIAELTKEQQHEWYLKIKQLLPAMKNLGNMARLEKSIAEYEHRNNIQ